MNNIKKGTSKDGLKLMHTIVRHANNVQTANKSVEA